MFFGGELFSAFCWRYSIIVFVAFCLAASSVYCLNDIADVENDRRHPVKCRRPVASGAVTPGVAFGLMCLFIILSMVCISVTANGYVMAVVTLYWLLNILYTLRLKHIAIMDVFIISTGFVLRLLGGGIAAGIDLSPWIVCMIFLLTLFLAFAKRRDDVVLYEEKGTVTRRTIIHYTLPFMNQTLGILASVTMVCYVIWSLTPDVITRFDSGYVYVTSVFVLAGILRYLQITIVEGRSGSPTDVVLSDRFIQICILFWLLFFLMIIYL